ncbi:protease modulator HflK [Sphingomonas bacterium]|uniref:protease modulator HflK n=1 Tax=Sphingomonas bacterium TaxID=1895847 RepID=UPI001576AC46|nr:protease modulator HflK [Sphingomonas bacterium]
MTILTGWFQRAPALHIDQPKGPWGGSGENGGGASGDGKPGGPRNPWSVPPKGAKPSALDDFLRRARGGGGPVMPQAPRPRTLWGIGAALIVGGWVVFTSFHPIGPQQRGVVTYFGAYARTLDPGISLTLPAPIATVTKVDVQNIRTDDLPAEGEGGGGERPMLTRDGNLIDLAYSVRWNISNPEDYVFQIKDPRETLKAVGESAMREEVANVTLDEALGPGRTAIEGLVQERMQRILDGYRSGLRIQGVAIKQADPPAAVNDAFKDVTAAQSDAATARNNATSYAQQRIAQAQGEAAAFDVYYTQYRLAPEVTRRRMYYETMEAVLANTDKTIVEPNGVMPYLPLDRARKLPDAPAADTSAGAPASGGGQ